MRRIIIKTSNGDLEYRITHRKRVTKRMHMELDVDGGLVIVAPVHWSEKQVRRVIRQNVTRVEGFLLRARKRRVTPLQYCHGERHLFLGKSYRLAVQTSDCRIGFIELQGNEILVRTSNINSTEIHKRLQNWYRQQAQQVFAHRLQVVSARADWVKSREPTLKLRRMKRTWGNCSSSGVIKLNTHLVKAPLAVIDSVLAHELCHLVEMNHGKAFYALLAKLNPAWKQDRQKLFSEGGLYLR